MEELCYAVINANSPSGKISEDLLKKVEEMVNEKVVEYVLTTEDNTEIDIISCVSSRGVLLMQLASNRCADTLNDLVAGISTPWEDVKLALVSKAEIPNLTKASVYIKGWGSKFEPQCMLKIIGKQNKGLEVDKWEVFHIDEETDGTLLVVGLDQTSLASLKRSQGRAFFRLLNEK